MIAVMFITEIVCVTVTATVLIITAIKVGKEEMNLSRYTKSELEIMTSNINLTEEEQIVFEMLCKGKTRVQIADTIHLSIPTVDRRIRALKRKIYR